MHLEESDLTCDSADVFGATMTLSSDVLDPVCQLRASTGYTHHVYLLIMTMHLINVTRKQLYHPYKQT